MTIKKANVTIFAIVVLASFRAFGDQVSLAWFPPAYASNDVVSYKVYYGNQSRDCGGKYTTVTNVGKVTSTIIYGLDTTRTHYFAITACYSNEESYYSQELVWDKTPPVIADGAGYLSLTNDCPAIPSILGSVLITDNFSSMSNMLVSQTPSAGTPWPLGKVTTVFVTAVDEAGNSSRVGFDATVLVEIVVDNTSATTGGSWVASMYAKGYYGTNYLHDGNSGKGTKSVVFRPYIKVGGDYEVSLWWPVQNSQYAWSSNTLVDVVSNGDTITTSINQRLDGGKWKVLSTNSFASGSNGFVRIRTSGTSGYVVADAVRMVMIGEDDHGLPNVPRNLREIRIDVSKEPVVRNVKSEP